MSDLSRRVVIVGGGVMGGAIATGLAARGWTQVSVVEPSQARRDELNAVAGLHATADLKEAVTRADVVVLAVKPGVVSSVARSISENLGKALVISIAAGVSLASLAADLPDGTPIVRVMPNTPAQVGEAMSVLTPGSAVSDEQLEIAGQVLDAVGSVIVLPEDKQGAATALSGCGPAYVFYLAEAMIEAGVQMGLTRPQAHELAVQTIAGSARLLQEGTHPSILRENVTSPGGVTAKALRVLDERAVRASISSAMWETLT